MGGGLEPRPVVESLTSFGFSRPRGLEGGTLAWSVPLHRQPRRFSRPYLWPGEARRSAPLAFRRPDESPLQCPGSPEGAHASQALTGRTGVAAGERGVSIRDRRLGPSFGRSPGARSIVSELNSASVDLERAESAPVGRPQSEIARPLGRLRHGPFTTGRHRGARTVWRLWLAPDRRVLTS